MTRSNYTKEPKYEDLGFKVAFDSMPEGVEEFLNLDCKILSTMPTSITNIEYTEKEMDTLFYTDKDYFIDIEFQSTNNKSKDDLMRFFYYGVSTMYKYGKPVHTYIIYNKNLKPKKEEITEGSFTFKPNIIYLSEIYLEDVVNRMEDNVRKYNKISELDELMLAISPVLNSNGNSSELIAQAVNLAKGSDKIDKIFNIISTLALKFLTTYEISELMEAIEVTGPIKDLIDRKVEERVEKELKERVEKELEERVGKELEERVGKELEKSIAKEKEQSIISVLHLLTDEQIADSFRVDINYVRELRKKLKDESNVELAKSNSFGFLNREK